LRGTDSVFVIGDISAINSTPTIACRQRELLKEIGRVGIEPRFTGLGDVLDRLGALAERCG